jgi:hypothetical protein
MSYTDDEINRLTLLLIEENEMLLRKLEKMTGGNFFFRKIANLYRRNYCNGKARQLKDGEYHLGCHNFTGPGTRIDLPEVANYPPYNDIDNCSKQHDLDYLEASEKDAETRARMIRDADRRVIECYQRYPNESGYKAALLGINSKMKLEDVIPILMKSITPNYFGKN